MDALGQKRCAGGGEIQGGGGRGDGGGLDELTSVHKIILRLQIEMAEEGYAGGRRRARGLQRRDFETASKRINGWSDKDNSRSNLLGAITNQST